VWKAACGSASYLALAHEVVCEVHQLLVGRAVLGHLEGAEPAAGHAEAGQTGSQAGRQAGIKAGRHGGGGGGQALSLIQRKGVWCCWVAHHQGHTLLTNKRLLPRELYLAGTAADVPVAITIKSILPAANVPKPGMLGPTKATKG